MHSRASSTARRPRAPSIQIDTSAVTDPRGPHSNTDSTDPKDGTKLTAPAWSHAGNSSPSAFSPSDTLGSPSSVASSAGSPECLGAAPSKASMEELFRPIPGDQEMFRADSNPFAFTPGHLSRLINPKSLRAFLGLGGLSGIEKGLRTDAKSGLSIDETDLDNSVSFEDATGLQLPEHLLSEPKKEDGAPSHHHKRGQQYSDRKRIFGMNHLPDRKSKSFILLVWIALQDKIMILLSVAAVVSLALGLYQTFGQENHEGKGVEWIEGVAIIVAIAVVSLVGAANDWKKERQFQKLNKKKDDREVNVIRSGKPNVISIHDILVGDLLMLEQGDVIPVDGIFVDGHNISCDESSATGESDVIKKTPAAIAQRILQNSENEGERIKKLDPFIISGARVLDGVGSCLVTAVGPHSSHGRTMLSLRDDTELTPLQMKLNLLAGYIAKLGSAAGLLLFSVLFIEFLARLKGSGESPQQKGQRFMTILITSITIVVVAVPEGLPLAVTLALSFATKKMTKENNLVRHLQSCETMGNATVICSDKTGTLTENVMTVVAGSLGNGCLGFGDQDVLDTLAKDGSADTAEGETGSKDAARRRELVSTGSLVPKLHEDVRLLLKQSIGINTTAFEGVEEGQSVFVGTKTETALLDWAKNNFALDSVATMRSNHPAVEIYPFNSGRKCMGTVIAIPGKKYRVFVKGAPEILLRQCHTVLDAPGRGLHAAALDQDSNAIILDDIYKFSTHSLRTLGLCFRDLDQWPPPARSRSSSMGSGGDSDHAEFTDLFREMTWIGVVGIHDPVRKGVADAIKTCARASVGVKMVTGDNIQTATAIAKACGLLEGEGGIVIEGVKFRRMNDVERDNVVGGLRVLARSSPEDKRVLVRTLQAKGQIVAVTGDGTNDAPALKAADVGFSMGIAGTEVAKEASDIILLDDNFTSIVVALGWGRAINDAVKKFLQFQITVNITAVLLTFVSAVASDHMASVITAVQLLWVNLIMDTFAALALATDPPNDSLLDKKPEPRTAPLITLPMWKMIIGQSIYQLAVSFTLHFGGPKFLPYPADQLRTLVFNTFVFMQIFKLVNSRRIDNNLNIFEGLSKNHLFMLMAAIMVGGQVLIIFVGGDAFSVVRITGPQWGISLVLGFLSIPVGVLIRLFPDAWIRACIPSWLARRHNCKAERISGEGYDLNAAMLDVRDDLAFFNRLRGGRMAFLCDPRLFQKQIQQARRRGSNASTSPMHPAVGMSGLMAASIGGLPSLDQARGDEEEGRGSGGKQGRARSAS